MRSVLQNILGCHNGGFSVLSLPVFAEAFMVRWIFGLDGLFFYHNGAYESDHQVYCVLVESTVSAKRVIQDYESGMKIDNKLIRCIYEYIDEHRKFVQFLTQNDDRRLERLRQ